MVSIPRELCHWTTFLTKELTLRSIGTFFELLISAIVNASRFRDGCLFDGEHA